MDGLTASSASHSSRNSRRRARGVSQDAARTTQWDRSRMTGAAQPAEPLEPLACGLQRGAPLFRDLVVAACRTLLAPRDFLAFPVRPDEPEIVEAPQRRIDGSGLQAGAVGDVEPVAGAVGDGLQHEGG